MKIETRYELGDSVYCIIAGKVVTRTVCGIVIKVTNCCGGPQIRYRFEGVKASDTLEEARVYATKDELLRSL